MDNTTKTRYSAEASKEAGAPEIEISPEMIEAGLRVLYQSGAIEHPLSIDADLVRDIFLAMHAQASRQ